LTHNVTFAVQSQNFNVNGRREI